MAETQIDYERVERIRHYVLYEMEDDIVAEPVILRHRDSYPKEISYRDVAEALKYVKVLSDRLYDISFLALSNSKDFRCAFYSLHYMDDNEIIHKLPKAFKVVEKMLPFEIVGDADLEELETYLVALRELDGSLCKRAIEIERKRSGRPLRKLLSKIFGKNRTYDPLESH